MRLFGPLRSAFVANQIAVGAIAFALVGIIWMVTYGTFELFGRETFGQFYDAQAQSLLAGRWDVAADTIRPEGFYRDRRGLPPGPNSRPPYRAYGYFGFVPALPRMLLIRAFPGMTGDWSRLSVTLGAGATLFFTCRLLRRMRRWSIGQARVDAAARYAEGGFLLCAGLGSTLIYLCSCAFIYHEAIVWAVALALACYDQVYGYLADGRLWRLTAACALAYLCFFCRISTGCGPAFTLLLLGVNIATFCKQPAIQRANTPTLLPACSTDCQRIRPHPAHAMLIGLVLTAILVTFVGINHAKFGTYFNPAPMAMHEQVFSNPGRWERTGGKWMRLGNIPTVAYAYLSPGSIQFDRSFPWVDLQPWLHNFRGQRMDGNGPFSSVTTAMPMFAALGIVGVIAVVRRRRGATASPKRPTAGSGEPSPAILLIGSLGSIAPLLTFASVDNRYLHDFFPFLVISAGIGLHQLRAVRPRGLKRAVAVVLILGGMYQIYVNCAFALVYQRLRVWSRPRTPEIQMRHWQDAIDRR